MVDEIGDHTQALQVTGEFTQAKIDHLQTAMNAEINILSGIHTKVEQLSLELHDDVYNMNASHTRFMDTLNRELATLSKDTELRMSALSKAQSNLLTQLEVQLNKADARVDDKFKKLYAEQLKQLNETKRHIDQIGEESRKMMESIAIQLKEAQEEQELQITFGHPLYLYVYCDIVQDSIVGNVTAPLLRILKVPQSKTYGLTAVQTFDSPHYIRLARHSFDRVEVYITDHAGNIAPFSSGVAVTTLHLRKVQT
jgi:hypothetical protein